MAHEVVESVYFESEAVHLLTFKVVLVEIRAGNVYASTPPLSFLQAGCPFCHPTNSVIALKATRKRNIGGNTAEYFCRLDAT